MTLRSTRYERKHCFDWPTDLANSLPSPPLPSLSQVWDWEPESGQQVLLVDYDPLQIANDPDLHRLLGQLMAGGVRSSEHTQPVLVTVVEWAWFLFLKGLEIGVEVLL